MMWRWIVLILVVLNGLFWLWSHGQLRDLGWGPTEVAEPARLKNQLHPEALVVKPLESPADNPSANAPAADAVPSTPAAPAPAITPSASSSAAPATTPGK